MSRLLDHINLSPVFEQHDLGSNEAAIVIEEVIQEKPGEGRYVVRKGNEKYFVRLTSSWNSFKPATDLNNYLAKRGCSVIPVLVSGVEFKTGSETLRIDVRPYVSGSKFDFTEQQLIAVIDEVSGIHSILADYPDFEEIKKSAGERSANLETAKQRILSSDASLAIMPDPDICEAMAHFNPDLGLTEGAQCIHGDLHPENVLIDDEGKPVIFDFEESSKSFLHPVYDLIYIYDRFAYRSEGRIDASLCYNLLAGKYGLTVDEKEFKDLAAKMYLRLILMVYDNHLTGGVPINQKEIEKFTLRYREMSETVIKQA